LESQTTKSTRQRLAGLWRNADFMKLWAGQTISSLGSHITRDGLPLLAVITLSATPAEMGILSAVSGAPVLLFGLAAGVWVDRLRRRPVLVAADVGRALLLASIPAAAFLGVLGMPQLYVVAALVGQLAVVFSVAYRSYLPSLVERAHIVEGNSKLAMSESVAELAGSGVTGVLVQVLTAPVAILLDSLSFAASVVSIALIRKPEPPPAPPESRKPILRELQEGLRLALGNPTLRALAGGAGTLAFLGNFFAALYGLYAIRVLGMGPAILGITIAMGGVGSMLGAALAKPAAKRFGLGRALMLSLVLGSCASMLIPLARGPLPVAVAMMMAAQVFGDCFDTVCSVNETSLRQAITPDRLLGRMNATVGFIADGAGPMGALVGGFLGGVIGLRPTLALAALGGACAAAWLFASPIRRLQDHPVAATMDSATGNGSSHLRDH
jgi:predicted MFS family arabinose efflux permease